MNNRLGVSLFDYTGNGRPREDRYAACVLVFTKSTRLQMSPTLFEEIWNLWPWERIENELRYMANTLPSSWEFVHYSFIITNVTRAFTHQLVRTRQASYAQQAMRVLNVSEGTGWSYETGPTIRESSLLTEIYDDGMEEIDSTYKSLIAGGARIEDARGLLPTNILTNICMSINMRNLVELLRKRSSARVQDEYRSVVEAMKAEILRVHPWVSIFLDRTPDNLAKEMATEIEVIPDPEKRTRMTKLLDQLRSYT